MMSTIPKPLVYAALSGLAGLLAACAVSNAINLPLSDRGNIQLPADTGTTKPLFDLLTFDGRRNLLYVAHTSSSSIDIVDTRARKVLTSIPGLPGIKQIALTADPNVVFASASAAGEVALVDTKAMKVLARITVNGSPDAIEYDPIHDAAVVASSGAMELSIIDRATRKVTSTVKLPGAPELMTVDAKGGRVYVAINDKDEVAVVDLTTHQVTELRGCDIKAPTGIAYDGDQGRLFVADRALVSVIDVVIDKCLGSIDIGNGVDQITLNPHKHHLYTANGGSRNLSVIDTISLQPLGEVGTGPSGDGVATDPATDLVYVIVGRAGIIATYHDP
jgi:DNA-binding beta-propeller fold protein YncE